MRRHETHQPHGKTYHKLQLGGGQRHWHRPKVARVVRMRRVVPLHPHVPRWHLSCVDTVSTGAAATHRDLLWWWMRIVLHGKGWDVCDGFALQCDDPLADEVAALHALKHHNVPCV